MKKPIRKSYCWWVGCGLIFVGMVFVGVISFGGLLGVYWFTPLLKPLPSVTIIQPDHTLEIESGQPVVLVARGESNQGIDYIDFHINDIPRDQKTSDQPKQDKLEAVFPWFSSQPGIHKLSVVAYDNLGSASSSDSVLVVVNPRSIPGASQPDSQGADANNLQPPSDTGDQPSGNSDDGEEQADLDQILENIDEAGEFPLDGPGQPQDAPPEITVFDIQTPQEGNQVNGTYHLEAEDDLGLDYLTFKLASLDNPLNPINTHHPCGGSRTCVGEGNFQLPTGGWILITQAVDTSGQASPIRSHQIHVLEGEGPLAIALDFGNLRLDLDPLLNLDELPLIDLPGDDIGDPSFTAYECSRGSVVIEVPYIYVSNHGDEVYIGAWARSGIMRVAHGNQLIEDRSGVAKFIMDYVSEEHPETDQLELYFRAGSGDYFYTEITDFGIHLPIPKPDLAVSSSSLSADALGVEVQNLGCDAASGFNLSIQAQEGAAFIRPVEAIWPPGYSGTWWTSQFFYPNLLSRGYKVTVDPDNAIEEINEDNNVYEKAPITLKHVQFETITINDPHDSGELCEDSKDGEFYFIICVNDDCIRTPESTRWVLEEADDLPLHESAIFYPILEWNDDLTIDVRCFEVDDNRPCENMDDFCGSVLKTHSHDITHLGSWKNGDSYYTLSDSESYRIRYHLVVE